jgi:hypothetical protein
MKKVASAREVLVLREIAELEELGEPLQPLVDSAFLRLAGRLSCLAGIGRDSCVHRFGKTRDHERLQKREGGFLYLGLTEVGLPTSLPTEISVRAADVIGPGAIGPVPPTLAMQEATTTGAAARAMQEAREQVVFDSSG